MLNSTAQLYTDLQIADIILGEGLSKQAQGGSFVSSLLDTVKNYVSNHIDPDDRVGSLVNILAPAVLPMAFGKIGWLAGLAMRIFRIDVMGILRSIVEKLKEALSGHQSLTSPQIDTMVQNSVQEASHTQLADDHYVSAALQIRQATLLKLSLTKNAAISKPLFTSFLGRILSLFFKIAVSAAGLMVAGDVINKLVGRPNALDNTIQKGKPVSDTATPTIPVVISTQTVFPLNPNYHPENYNTRDNNWMINAPNNPNSIGEILINFAQDVYQGLDGQENSIRATTGFNTLVDTIAWYNHTSEGGPIFFIPTVFHNKKQIVDHFIDQVAQQTHKSKEINTPSSNNMIAYK